MKTMLILIFLFTFLNLNAQVPASWNDEVITYVPFEDYQGERVAIFANQYGIHLLKTRYSGVEQHVKYFRLTSEGEKPVGFPAEGISLDSYGDFPNIVGDQNIIYAVYRKDYTVQVKYSINGGNNWSSLNQINFFNSNAINCNGIDAAYTFEKGLHVVWSEKVGGYYESYFYRYYVIGGWQNFRNLTDASPIDYGGFPTVTTSFYGSTHKAHVSINTGNGDIVGLDPGLSYSRDYDYSTWSAPIAILPYELSYIDRLLFTKDDGNIHCFYYKENGSYESINYRKKLVTSSNWGEEKLIDLRVDPNNQYKIQIAKTSGDALTDIVHVFWMNAGPGIYHRKKNSSDENWTIPKFLVSTFSVDQIDAGITSSSNDLFTMWSFGGAEPYYYFRHYDDKQLAPTNLTITESPNNHPYLDWNPNLEPDISTYYIYRKDYYGGGWQYLTQTTNNYYEDQSLTYCHAIPPAQCPNLRTFDFYVTAVDINSHESDPSNIVSARLIGGPPSKAVVNDPDGAMAFEYLLEQNYPNPFNPTTTINYSIKSAGDISLKVYDILGTEVASLVNERQEAGSYSVEFNAGNLPSGMYVYILSTNNFVDTKKLILLK